MATLPRHDFPQVAESNSKTLVAKLAEVCEAIGGVGKNGKNEEDGYHYQRWRDIASAVRGEMCRRGLILIPQDVEILSEQRFPTESVKHGIINAPLVELKLKRWYEITDGVNSQWGIGIGAGQDYRDKALYKAETGALKYFLRGLFLIPDIEDDAEEVADRAQAELAEVLPLESRISQAQRKNEQTYAGLAERAVRSWNTLCHNHGRTIKQRREYLRVTFGVNSVADLKSKLDYDRAIVWAANREELGETLAASVEAVKAQPAVAVMDAPKDPF